MTNLYQDQGFLLHPGEMPAHVRAAYPATGRVLAVFIDELTADNDNLFTTPVGMRLKNFIGRPAYQRGTLGVMLV